MAVTALSSDYHECNLLNGRYAMKMGAGRPKVVDLFAGVGGMSLGAARAGWKVHAAVENDPIALSTHQVNFPTARHLGCDISRMSGAKLLAEVGLVEGELDALIGGPPCQGFSDIGKRSLVDPRNTLFGEFFRLVAEVKPRLFVAENVPGILATRNAAVVRQSLGRVPDHYVVLDPIIVSAHDVGAPTTRTRVFFVGYDPHRVSGIDRAGIFSRAASPVTVKQALLGLPAIRANWQTENQGWRKVGKLPVDDLFYRRVTDRIPPGVGARQAVERLNLLGEISGNIGTRHTPEVVLRFSTIRPGKTDPVSRAPRLVATGFCPTLRAGTGSDRGSFQALRPIHYGSPRVITPREAARLQGFPDWFQFHGTKWHSFRQIGNSVSPIVAEELLRDLRACLEP